MTEKLQSLQRQVLDGAVGMPRGNGFAQLGNAFNGLAGTFGQVAVNQAVQQATTQAGADAQADFMAGSAREMPASIGAATQKYIAAYNDISSKLIINDTNQMMQEALIQGTSKENLNPNSLASLNQQFTAIMEGALQSTPEGARQSVALRLGENATRYMGAASMQVQKLNNEIQAKSFNTLFTQNKNDLFNGVLSGDEELAKSSYEDARQLIDDSEALGNLDRFEADESRRAVEDIKLSAEYSKGYLDSIADETESQFLVDLANNKDKLDQRALSVVQQEVISLKSKQDRLYAERDREIAAELRAQEKAFNAQKKERKLNEDISNFIRDAGVDSFKADSYSAEVKNATYNQSLEAILENKRELTGDPNAALTMTDKASVAESLRTPIPEFNDEMTYSIVYGDAASAFDSILAYQSLTGTPGGELKTSKTLKLNDKASQIAVTSLFINNFTTATPEEAIERARETVNNKDDVVVAGRMAAFNRQYSGVDGVQDLESDFNDVFGVDAASEPVVFEAFKKNYRINTASMQNLTEALEMTKRSMTNIYGRSKYSSNPNGLMQFAPESTVDFSTEGKWFDNQFVMAAQRVAKNQDSAMQLSGEVPDMFNELQSLRDKYDQGEADDLPAEQVAQDVERMQALSRSIRAANFQSDVTVRVPEGAELPATFDESDVMNQLLNKKSAKGSLPVLEINGKNRQVFLLSNASSGTGSDGRPVYGMYYLDDFGITQPVPDPFSESGFAEFRAKSINEFIPGVYEEMRASDMQELATREARAVLDASQGKVSQFTGRDRKSLERRIQRDKDIEEATAQIMRRLEGES